MKKISLVVLAVMLSGLALGCAKKTASEQLADDMKKMQSDMNKAAKKVQADLQ